MAIGEQTSHEVIRAIKEVEKLIQAPQFLQ